MAITRFDPFNEIRRLENEISNVFRNIRDDSVGSGFYQLPVNIMENPDEYMVQAHVPGFTSDEIDIEATSQYIRIKAEKDDMELEDDTEWVLQELQNLHLVRRIGFDKPIQPSESSTTLENGVLRLRLPKMEEAKSTRLEISDTPELEA